jgi:uncharacterized protein
MSGGNYRRSSGSHHRLTTIGCVEQRDWQSISVTASGEATLSPDLALVSLTVSGSGKELPSTRDEVNARASAVLARLRDLGVADADLIAPDVAINPDYDYRRGQRLIGYRVARRILARVRDLERLGEVLDGVVAAGANEVHGAQMMASDPSAAEQAALAEAVTSAQAKAAALAHAAGVKLGAVTRIEEQPDLGSIPMPRMQAMAAMPESADFPTEVAAGELTVTRHVRVWFAIA